MMLLYFFTVETQDLQNQSAYLPAYSPGAYLVIFSSFITQTCSLLLYVLYAHNTIKIRKTILIDSAWFILQEYKKLRLYTIFFVSEANLNISATNVTFFSLYLLTELESCSLLSDFSSYAFRFCKLFHSSNSLFIFPAYCLTAHCKLWNILCNAVHLYIRYLTNFMISDFMTFIQT